MEGLRRPLHDRTHPCDAVAVEQWSVDRGVTDDVQVGPPAYLGGQIIETAGAAPLQRIGQRHRAIAVTKIAVHVGDKRNLLRLGIGFDGA